MQAARREVGVVQRGAPAPKASSASGVAAAQRLRRRPGAPARPARRPPRAPRRPRARSAGRRGSSRVSAAASSPISRRARVPNRWCSSPPRLRARAPRRARRRRRWPGAAGRGQAAEDGVLPAARRSTSPVMWVAKPATRPPADARPFAVRAGQAGEAPARRPVSASRPTSLVSSPRITSGTPVASAVDRPGTSRQLGAVEGHRRSARRRSPRARRGRAGRAPPPSPGGCRPCRRAAPRVLARGEPGADRARAAQRGSRRARRSGCPWPVSSRSSTAPLPASEALGAQAAGAPVDADHAAPVARPSSRLASPSRAGAAAPSAPCRPIRTRRAAGLRIARRPAPHGTRPN